MVPECEVAQRSTVALTLSSGASAAVNVLGQRDSQIEIGVGQCPRADRCDAACRATAERSQSVQQPAAPARGRGPRRIARSRFATAGRCENSCPPSLHSGCLKQSQQRHRLAAAERHLRGEPCENAGAACRRARSPPESSTGTFQRASAASTRRASARSGVIRAAVRVALCDEASLDRLAQRDCDGERFLFRVRRFDNRRCPQARSVFAARRPPLSGVSASDRLRPLAATLPTAAFRGRKPHASPSSLTASRVTSSRCSSACMENCGWP